MSQPVVVLAKRLHHPAGEAVLERYALVRVLGSLWPHRITHACAGPHALVSALSGRRIAEAALDIEEVPQ